MVNSSYIANATDIFDRMVRFNEQTGYLFGHGIVMLVMFFAAYRSLQTGQGTAAAAGYSAFYGLLVSTVLWGAGWESSYAPIFCLSFLLLVLLVHGISEST